MSVWTAVRVETPDGPIVRIGNPLGDTFDFDTRQAEMYAGLIAAVAKSCTGETASRMRAHVEDVLAEAAS